MRIEWWVVAQSRLRMPLEDFFETNGVRTYEEAASILKRFGQPVGPREEVVAYLSHSSDSDSATRDSDPAPSPRPPRRTKKVQPETQSPAEDAADAISSSKAVKSPKAKASKGSRKRKKS